MGVEPGRNGETGNHPQNQTRAHQFRIGGPQAGGRADLGQSRGAFHRGFGRAEPRGAGGRCRGGGAQNVERVETGRFAEK